eukprot:1813701-Pleurochrysis_carterae.AAC.2
MRKPLEYTLYRRRFWVWNRKLNCELFRACLPPPHLYTCRTRACSCFAADDETEEVPLPTNNLASDNVAAHLDAKAAETETAADASHPKPRADAESHQKDLVKHLSLDAVLATAEFDLAAAKAEAAPSAKPAAGAHGAQTKTVASGSKEVARPGMGGDKIPPAGVRCLQGVAISPAPRQPDAPYQEYLEAYRRYCAAAAAKPPQPAV